MPAVDPYAIPNDLVLGLRHNARVPETDQRRQRLEVEQILRRFRAQPGVILADEVGMGKTFVALGVAYAVASQSRSGPVIIMVPPNLVDKWEQDLKTFCELYIDELRPMRRDELHEDAKAYASALRYGVARHSIDFMKLLDDKPSQRCQIIFLAQGAMARSQSDKWVRLALIREALRRHARGKAKRLIKVKKSIHRYMAQLLFAMGHEKASDWGEELWGSLLRSDPMEWMRIYNSSVRNENRHLDDDPVPESVVKALSKIDLKEIASALEELPIRSSVYTEERVSSARHALKVVEQDLWKELLTKARWRSPLLVMDEAHHLKNPHTSLARQLQSPDAEADLKMGDGAMARSFERMLFLTATPFQLGHQELARVMERFGDVRWSKSELGERKNFEGKLEEISSSLTESQRTAVNLQRCWSRLLPEEGPVKGDPNVWWQMLLDDANTQLTPRQRSLVDAYQSAREWRATAEKNLRPWVIRHNKGDCWSGTDIDRRNRLDGESIRHGEQSDAGLDVPKDQILPFFLAARSAVDPGKDLLGEALCSSYEAFRSTRTNRADERDDIDGPSTVADFSHADWYLEEFDEAILAKSGAIHPKIAPTVKRAVDLWEQGEKVLIFAFYRYSCRALRIHISKEIENRITTLARRRFAGAGKPMESAEIHDILEGIQKRYFDNPKLSGRQALDRALLAIVNRKKEVLERADVSADERVLIMDVMRRFLRVQTTLVRTFPIHKHTEMKPSDVMRSMLDTKDQSGMPWRAKFENFIDFLATNCSSVERQNYLEACARTQTGRIRVTTDEAMDLGDDDQDAVGTLPNVQVATGSTKREGRSRLMRTFNTPFFPDILVCSQVMGEGVDLQRCCHYVIHHDLAWNPSTIEQRTGRIDRLGCKAESRHPIHIFLPYIAGTADERQYRVMTDRERWFRIVMGQDEVAKLIPRDGEETLANLPDAFTEGLSFDFSLKTSAQ